MTYALDGDLVFISPKPLPTSQMNDIQAAAPAPSQAPLGVVAQAPALPGMPREAEAAPASIASQRQVSQALNFKNVNAGDVAPILARPGVQVSATSNSQAVLTGSEEAVNQAASLATALDRDAPGKAPVRPITLKAQFEFKRPIKGNVQISDGVYTPIISTLDGQEAKLKVSTAPLPNSSKKTSDFVSFSLTPTIRPDQRIGVSGTFDYDMYGYFIRDAKIAATLEPGKPQKQPTISIPSNDGKSKATGPDADSHP